MSEQKVLLVDDISENLQVLGNLLGATGLDLSFATNGEQAIQTCQKWQPDLVLLDVMMPGMDGFEVCRRLKADPQTADIPVIFLTARTDEASVLDGFDIGAVDYLTKPFRPGELLARVRSQLELKQARDALIERNHSLLELNGTLHRLLSVISHDLKSPLGSMVTLIDLRRKSPSHLADPVALQDFLDLLSSSLRKSFDMLDHLLAWSRSQSGGLEPRPGAVCLRDLIEDVLNILAGVATAKGVRVIPAIEGDITVWADREMLRTVLHNLVMNAIKFSHPDGEIRIEASCDDDRACIRVRDFGVGISAEHLALLFRPDRPITTAGTLKEPGSGFGLILCREFVMRNGGELTVTGRPGEGVTAAFSLPLSREAAAEATVQ